MVSCYPELAYFVLFSIGLSCPAELRIVAMADEFLEPLPAEFRMLVFRGYKPLEALFQALNQEIRQDFQNQKRCNVDGKNPVGFYEKKYACKNKDS